MDMTPVRDALARSLAKMIDVPLIPEQYEEAFFQGIVDRIWGILPVKVQQAISSTSTFLSPDEVSRYSEMLLRALTPVLNRALFWRTDNADVARQVTSALMLMSADKADARSLAS
jgi:hypothetical protein